MQRDDRAQHPASRPRAGRRRGRRASRRTSRPTSALKAMLSSSGSSGTNDAAPRNGPTSQPVKPPLAGGTSAERRCAASSTSARRRDHHRPSAMRGARSLAGQPRARRRAERPASAAAGRAWAPATAAPGLGAGHGLHACDKVAARVRAAPVPCRRHDCAGGSPGGPRGPRRRRRPVRPLPAAPGRRGGGHRHVRRRRAVAGGRLRPAPPGSRGRWRSCSSTSRCSAGCSGWASCSSRRSSKASRRSCATCPPTSQDIRDSETLRDYDDRYHITDKIKTQSDKLPRALDDAAGELEVVTVGLFERLFELVTVLVMAFFLLLDGPRWRTRCSADCRSDHEQPRPCRGGRDGARGGRLRRRLGGDRGRGRACSRSR